LPDWLEQILPESTHAIVGALLHPHALIALGVLSAVTFVASLLGVPYFLTRLPADYFSRNSQSGLGIRTRRSLVRVALRCLQNLLGFALLVLGVAMLVLPGQGLLTIFAGLLLMDFPGKRRFERWIITRSAVLRGINSLRRRAGYPPLEPRVSRASKAPPSSLPEPIEHDLDR
jgi:hypothetical protein